MGVCWGACTASAAASLLFSSHSLSPSRTSKHSPETPKDAPLYLRARNPTSKGEKERKREWWRDRRIEEREESQVDSPARNSISCYSNGVMSRMSLHPLSSFPRLRPLRSSLHSREADSRDNPRAWSRPILPRPRTFLIIKYRENLASDD